MSDDAAVIRIEGALRGFMAGRRSPRGWEERVLTVRRRAQARRTWMAAATGLAAAATLTVVSVRGLPMWPGSTPPLALSVVVEQSEPNVRAQIVGKGSVVTATVSGGRHRALWIYRTDDDLRVACPGERCASGDGTMAARVALDSVGTYTIVALASDAPIPAPHGSLDADVAAARRAGATDEQKQLDAR
jgi:hypothetical protein